jgi:methionyl-tRNA formyltransferase
VPSLQQFIAAPEFDVVAAVTQPDAPAGRGRALSMSPVKRLALKHGLLVLQFERVRRPEAVAALGSLQPDVIVVAAFGQILPRSVLDIPPRGTLNVHASLLPRWRGASPITAAILAGDSQTGVTIMRLDEGMDTGPILSQASLPILSEDTTGSLTERLAELGAQLLMQTLPRWLNGEIQPRPQDSSQATTCAPVRKESGRMDWRQPAAVLERVVRAYSPWPGAFCLWNGRLLKIVQARVVSAATAGAEPGEVGSTPEGPAVVTGDGLLLLVQLQLEGRRGLPAADFLRGQRDFVGSRLD